MFDFFHYIPRSDIVLLSVLCLSFLWGMFRGFSRETSIIFAFIIALWSAFHLGDIVSSIWADKIPPVIRTSAPFHYILGLIIFTVSIIVLGFIFKQIAKQFRSLLSGGVDAFLGAIYGLVRGYILLVIIFSVFSWFAPQWLASLLEGSNIAPWIFEGVRLVQGHIPNNLMSSLSSSFPAVMSGN